MNLESEITLFHWNILELDDDFAIFVGLRMKAGEDSSSPNGFTLRRSTKVISFNEITGHGLTLSGRNYHCFGAASDPDQVIRRLIFIGMGGRPYRFRYAFSLPDD